MNPLEHALWLWDRDLGKNNNLYLDFYEALTVEKQNRAEKYTMYISADADYALYLNGGLFDFGQFADYEDAKVYDVLDLTDALREGENELKITVRACGRDFSTYRKAQPGVIFAVCGDEKPLILSSGETLMAKNPAYQTEGVETVSGQLGFSYGYDATQEGIPTEKKRAHTVQKPLPVRARPVKKLTVGGNQDCRICAEGLYIPCRKEGLSRGQRLEYSFLSAREFGELADCSASKFLPSAEGIVFHGERFEDEAEGVYAVFDLGAESTGVLSLDIEVSEATDILIGYGEHLDDLRPRSYISGRNFALYYRAKPGRNTFVGPFLRLGLRYLQLNIGAKSFTLYYAGIKPTDYPLDRTPYFSSADHLHNKIYEVSVRTLEKCMHGHYEDCPWREQALYSMDSRNQMLCGYYTFGEYTFARESIRLMAQSLRSDGMLELCSPARVPITIPSFSAVFVVLLEEYLRYSGDTGFVAEMLPVARAITEEFLSQLDKGEKLLRCRPEREYWNFYEWQAGLEGDIFGTVKEEERTYDAPMNAFFSMALRAISRIEAACGESAAALRYAGEKRLLDGRIHRVFWNGEKEAYATFVLRGEQSHYAELTNSLIVCADACPTEYEDRVLAALAGKKLLPVTLSHSIFKYEALLRKPEAYGRYVFEDVARVFGRMVYSGATTFWETEEGSLSFGDAGSLCHGWSAIPAYLYFAYGLGLKPTENGFAAYEVKPVDSGIPEVSGLAVTPVGQIKL